MLPVKTVVEGNKTTKIVVDDIYKSLNRILIGLDDLKEKITDITDSVHKTYEDYEGELIIGIGHSRPCQNDVYDEIKGSEIAFKKAKLNGNIKKLRVLNRIFGALMKYEQVIFNEQNELVQNIHMDYSDLLKENPNFDWKW